VSWLDLHATWSYIDARFTNFVNNTVTPAVDETSSPFSYTPKTTFSLIATVTLPAPEEVGKMNLSATWSYRSLTFLSNLQDTFYETALFQPAYSVVNLQFQWNEIYGRPIDLTLWVKNVGNKTYIDGDSGETYQDDPFQNQGVDTVFFAPPRTFGATLHYHFGGG
jgi:iron complex outermembrane receptor protein